MTRFLCIQRSKPSGSEESEKPSSDQMDKMYAKFEKWKEKFEDNIVDMGGKLGDGKVVTADGAKDGPFTEAKEVVGGYMIIEADSIEDAVKVAQESPGTAMPGASVEVREISTF